MKHSLLLVILLCAFRPCFSWGFFGHREINYYAVFLLPPQMMIFYKSNLQFISEHAIDPDKRRYALTFEAPRHFIDIDHYGAFPYDSLPRQWDEAVKKFSEDSLLAHGIVPWWVPVMEKRLEAAFRRKDGPGILKLSAELGHYVADAHVPLHACSNHNGQFTGQKGIHAFWESRIPELLAEKEWDFFIGRAAYLNNPSAFIWKRVLESAAAADTVLKTEKELTETMGAGGKYAFENKNGVLLRQYSTAFSIAYNERLHGMIERRMRQSIFAVASFWYTAWVNAGQPDLSQLTASGFSKQDLDEFELLDKAWQSAGRKDHD